ncbi:oxidoreductase [Lactobacillus koreensis] [Lactiplantibacillus mudanjiangensis]|uniref:NAD(P)H-binding protein n=1 Tax=Lactiplantibacillus mudanjiangensis TaxID=1296538 RepID=UPI001015A18A|nr:NAD(P)H-binding protein [Lactiplantibacillus mudanjiangensis]VDG33034.1 oxidoreductase [Lactobacillus koreensis] [Lactiplantibacillus mudanjiangensis]
MMKKILILAANGQIARIVEQRLLTEPDFQDVSLTLFLRQASRLQALADNDRVTIIDGDITDAAAVNTAMVGQDIVFVAAVDHDPQNRLTKNVIAAMQANHVQRVLFTNVLGLYNEVPGEFGRWNLEMIGNGMAPAQRSDALLAASDLAYTTLRLPWLNDRDEINYQLTTKDQPYNGVSGSRQSIADIVLQLIKEPSRYQQESLGIADSDTQGQDRPVY